MNAADPGARGAEINGASSLDADNPWLGLASFTEQTRGYFYGREEEVAELERRVQRKLLTALFGKSGLGKTSILQAGLVPRLRERGYFPVYLRIDYGHDSPEPCEQIKQAIAQASAAGQWTQTGVAAPGESIWEFLHHRDDVLKDASGAKLTPLLIFDQFEELFTLAQSDEFGRTRAALFVEELADLVENRPPQALEARLETDEGIAERFDFSRSDYRLVIALREDYLAALESLKKLMPSLSQNRLRLAPMTGAQALEAVLRPGRHLVSKEVAEAIVRFVAGGAELANAEVEPSLLSLICRELNEQRIAQGRTEVSQDLLAGSHETILSNFYERALADQPAGVRRIIEDELLTESGYRENLAEESLLRRLQAAGAAPDALAKLVNRRLLRIEERLDVRRVELTHDVLTGVVKASRDQRHEREAREAIERTLAEQREREQAARRALRRVRVVAAGCILLAILAILAAALAFMNVRRARRAEQLARQTRGVSEQARQQAEALLGFLTDNFVRELQTFGRYQTIVELSQQEIDYFHRLPPQLKEPETIRSAALALLNHADALSYTGDLSTAGQNATDAIALLEGLRRGGDRSDATAVALANAYATLASALVIQANPAQAKSTGDRAVALLRPILARAHAPADARRAAAEVLGWRAFLEAYFTGPVPQAVQDGRDAQRLAVQLGALRSDDVTLDADYAYAGIGLVLGLNTLGRREEGLRAAMDALSAADRALSQRPQYGRALYAKQFIEQGAGIIVANELDPAQGLRYQLQGVQDSLALVQIEPGNKIYVNNLATLEFGVGEMMRAAGRLRESVAYFKESMGTMEQASTDVSRQLSVAFLGLAMSNAAVLQAQLGDAAGAAATLAAGEAFTSVTRLRALGLSPDTPAFSTIYEEESAASATLAYERGDYRAARRIAREGLARVHSVLGKEPAQFPYASALCDLSAPEGRADYELGDYAAAAQAERTALPGCKASTAINRNGSQRDAAQVAAWLAMALARSGRREEAARTLAPVVQLYQGLAARNRGDRQLPLEYAEVLYAQSLSDPGQSAALLRAAVQQMDHLIPAIARLRDTRRLRARIEEAQRRAGGAAAAE